MARATATGELKVSVADLRGELQISVTDLRGELQTLIADLRGELKSSVSDLRGEIRELRGATASKSTIIIGAIALFAALSTVIIGTASLSWQGFGTGLAARDIAQQAAREAVREMCRPAPGHPC